MKNQYFGDINDYRKYGLLRAILDSTQLKMLVAWMLTPDDGGTDGQFTEYLEQLNKWRHYDPKLFDGIERLMNNKRPRGISLIEETNLLSDAAYYSEEVPDLPIFRKDVWLESLRSSAIGYDIVFLDPDKGLEIKTVPYGRKDSIQYLYWQEVQAIWKTGNSILIYQHFHRKEHSPFIQCMLESLRDHTTGASVGAFSTARVVFLLALQPKHQNHLESIVKTVDKRWGAKNGRKAEIRYHSLDWDA